jgi:hypothetical protein
MKRFRVHLLVESLRLHLVRSDGEGIIIKRSGIATHMPWAAAGERTPLRLDSAGSYWSQEWRLRCGSGIAGKSGSWFLCPVTPFYWYENLGPYTTVRALEKALRAWNRFELP